MFCLRMAPFEGQNASWELFETAGNIGFATDDGKSMPSAKLKGAMNINEFMLVVVGSRKIDETVAQLARDKDARASIASHWHRLMTRCALANPTAVHPRAVESRFLCALASKYAGREWDDSNVPVGLRTIIRAGAPAALIYWSLVKGIGGNMAREIIEDIADYLEAQELLNAELKNWHAAHDDAAFCYEGQKGRKAERAFLMDATNCQWERIERTFLTHAAVAYHE